MFRSNKHIYAQVIDDVSRPHARVRRRRWRRDVRRARTATVAAAKQVGQPVGERAKSAGVEPVVLDRGGFRYHGRVAAVADGAREAGLDALGNGRERSAHGRRPVRRASDRHQPGRQGRQGRPAVLASPRSSWSGDGTGNVGLGYGKAKEVPAAIQKGMEEARRTSSACRSPATRSPTRSSVEHDAARVLLKPAAPGTGVIAGGSRAAILEAAGVHDVLARSLGSSNAINVSRAMIARPLRRCAGPTTSPSMRGKSPEEVSY